MRKFRYGDKIKVLEGSYGGRTGVVYGWMSRKEAEGSGADTEASITYYQIHLDGTDELAFVEEGDLVAD
jgi:hypothetical protein